MQPAGISSPFQLRERIEPVPEPRSGALRQASTFVDYRLDAPSRLDRVLVFPYPDTQPTGLREPPVGVPVALPVALHFVRPELGVGRGNGVMFGTAVPEASVQENSDLGPGEHEVGRPSDLLERPNAHPVAQAQSVDGGPKSKFRFGVPALVRLHAGADPR